MKARGLVFVLAMGLLVAADKPKKEDGKKGVKGLDGTWEVVSATRDGKANENAKGDKVVFAGNNVTVQGQDGEHKGTVQVDPKKKTMDFTPTEGEQKGQTFKGIYELKKGELKVCLAEPGKDRPKEFTSEEGSGRMLVVMKRAKAE
jgi:uncharacterized protein (TIGR03067 family)